MIEAPMRCSKREDGGGDRQSARLPLLDSQGTVKDGA
jgi:hypothetical protein